MTVVYVVHTCPARRGLLELLEQSLAESDVPAEDTVWMECPETTTVGIDRWWARKLRDVCQVAQYVVRLEDDVLVNRHLHHNVLTWSALQSPLFGVGWLFVSPVTEHCIPCDEDAYGVYARQPGAVPGAQGIVYESALVPRLMDALPHVTMDVDFGLGMAAGRLQRRQYLHRPALVTCSVLGRTQSVLGNPGVNEHYSPSFDAEWRRKTIGPPPTPEERSEEEEARAPQVATGARCVGGPSQPDPDVLVDVHVRRSFLT